MKRQETCMMWVWTMLIAFAVTVAPLQGCDNSIESVAYKTISTAQIAYDATMKVAADRYKAGEISEEQKEKIIEAAKPVYASLKLAAEALKVYHEVKSYDKKAELESSLSLLEINVERMNQKVGAQ